MGVGDNCNGLVSGIVEIMLRNFTSSPIACSRLSVSKDGRKSERAKSGISGERDTGEKRRGWPPDLSFFPTRPHSSLGLSRLCSATFEQLLAFGATF